MFEKILYMYVVQYYSYISIYIYVLLGAVIFNSHMYCINVIYNIFLYFNNNNHLLLCELLSTTMWNIPMLCHIHDINRKFQVIVNF